MIVVSIIKRPNWINSPYVEFEEKKWVYEEDAPSEIKKSVDDYNKKIEKEARKSVL